jgi:carboxymethylenebutenolidase
MASEVVTIVVDDPAGPVEMSAYLATPSDRVRGSVIVAHELFGVNSDIQSIVDSLAEQGYLAIAPEFYHRFTAPGTSFANDDAGRAQAFSYVDKLTREQAINDVAATMRFLDSRAQDSGPISILGFSFGGHLAYLAATQLDLASAAVLYAGWLPVTDVPLSQPEPTLDLTPGIAAHGGKITLLVGDADHVINAEQREQIAAALKTANVDHDVVIYPDVGHAFFWEAGEAFNREARDDAWARVLDLFSQVSQPIPQPR